MGNDNKIVFLATRMVESFIDAGVERLSRTLNRLYKSLKYHD